jgi:hypothetical protein
MMDFEEALCALASEAIVRRSSADILYKMCRDTVPVLAVGLMGSIGGMVPLGKNWLLVKVPLIYSAPGGLWGGEGKPATLTDADLAATDWEIMP